MIGGIFSIACALYVRNVLKLTRETPHKQLPHGAYARCLGVCIGVCVSRRLIKLIEFDCRLATLASALCARQCWQSGKWSALQGILQHCCAYFKHGECN